MVQGKQMTRNPSAGIDNIGQCLKSGAADVEVSLVNATVSRDLALIVPESWVPPKENDISILRRGHAAQPAEGLSATYSARSAMTGSTCVARRVGT